MLNSEVKRAEALGAAFLEGVVQVHAPIVTQRDTLSKSHRDIRAGKRPGIREPSRTMDKEALGARIAHYRSMRELTQEDLADRLGYTSHSRVANYEAGRRTPSLEDTLEIAGALGITVQHLLSDVDLPSVEATSYLSGEVRGHVRIQRLEGFDKTTGPSEIYLPDFLIRQRVPQANIRTLRWLRNPTSAMRPRIQLGALVLVDTAHNDLADVIDGETYAIRLYGRADIKRIRVTSHDSIEVVSDRETDNRHELVREDYSNLTIGGLVIDCL